MIRTISTAGLSACRAAALALVVAGCAVPPVVMPASDALVCVALGRALPVRYHAAGVDAESRANIMRANAAFVAACPARPAP